jgi:2-iminobutanoate/2-iminopropanoate deaminase
MAARPLQCPEAPRPIGPYAVAWRAGDLVFTSGQGPVDPSTGRLSGAGIEEQTALVLENLRRVLLGAGAELRQIIKVNAYLTDMSYFDGFNRAFGAAFVPPYPARTTVATGLLGRMLVEMDCVAYVGPRGVGDG